ncbi:MFS transporter [Streptomyces avidinii]|uniref:MDR family MFS transporter n=1 Tax=Streptomyces avidinii TaxID=1895 RepID=UPI00386DF6D5|nr:MFS transporter [Streptomyces avidinii]
MSVAGRAVRETFSGLPAAYWWLWTSTLVNRLGGFVVTFLAMYLTVERSFSASYAGLVAALYGLGGSVAAVIGGVLSDRIGRRATLLAASLATAASTAVLGLVTQPTAIAVTACGVGLASNASRPAVSAMMADLVAPEDQIRAHSLNYWAVNVGFGVSAAAAGLISAHGWVWLFLGDALTTLLCAMVVFVRVPETRPSEAGTGGTAPVIGLSQVCRDRPFMALVALTFLLGTIIQQAFTTLPVDMGRSGFGASDYGRVVALNGLLIVLLQIPLARWAGKRGTDAVLPLGALLLGWGFGLTAFAGTSGPAGPSGSVWLYALSVTVWTLGEIVYTPASAAAVAGLSPLPARGRYQGVHALAWAAASLVGPAAGGAAMDRFGAGVVWGACAVVGTAAAGGFWALTRRPV